MVPRRRAGVLECDLVDDLLVYAHHRAQAVALNGSARAIWERCDGRFTVEQITDNLALLTGFSVEELLPQVCEAVTRMWEAGILEDASFDADHVL